MLVDGCRDTQEVIEQGGKLMMPRGMAIIRSNMLVQATPDMLLPMV
jgi:hypothetical protein